MLLSSNHAKWRCARGKSSVRAFRLLLDSRLWGFLNKNNRLRGRYVESLSAAVIFAHKLIVHTHHVITRFFEPSAVPFVQAAWLLPLFYAFHPANVVFIAFLAVRARKTRPFRLLLFVENIAFVHRLYCSLSRTDCRTPMHDTAVNFSNWPRLKIFSERQS